MSCENSGGDKHVLILAVLLVLALFNIMFDYRFTSEAMDRGGYYETNKFTNLTDLKTHTVVLALVVTVSFVIGVLKKGAWYSIPYVMLLWMNVVWIVNNVISYCLLT